MSRVDKFEPYLNDRLILKKENYVLIKPNRESRLIPLGCSVCEFLYRTHNDEKAHETYGCCHRCAEVFVYPDRKRWSKGWRPNEDQIKRDVESRQSLSIMMK